MKKKLITDADGVLLNWNEGVVSYNKHKGIDHEHLDGIGDYNSFYCYTDLFRTETKEKSLQEMKNYNESRFTRNLGIFEEGSDIILKDLSKEYDIIILSSFGASEISRNNRILNLKDVYGDIFKDFIILDFYDSKEKYLKELNKNNDVVMWVDDIHSNVLKGISAGIDESYQYTHRMNCGRNKGGVKELSSWLEVKRILSI